MGRTLLQVTIAAFASAILGVIAGITATRPAAVEAQTSAPPAAALTSEPCPSGPGVIPTVRDYKTRIMPPTLNDSSLIGFSHGIRSGRVLFIAGERGVGPDFESQTRRVFATIETILETAGGSLDDLVLTTTFLTDESYSPEYSALRREILGDDLPAGGRVIVGGLGQALIEVQAVAMLPCH